MVAQVQRWHAATPQTSKWGHMCSAPLPISLDTTRYEPLLMEHRGDSAEVVTLGRKCHTSWARNLTSLDVLVQCSGAGKTKLAFTLGQLPGIISIFVPFSVGASPCPAFLALRRDLKALDGSSRAASQPRCHASVALDLVNVFILAHMEWVARVLEGLHRSPGRGATWQPRDIQLAILHMNYGGSGGVDATQAYERLKAQLLSVPDVATLVTDVKTRLVAMCAAFGLHVKGLCVCLDEVHAAMGRFTGMFYTGDLLRGFALAMVEFFPGCSFVTTATAQTPNLLAAFKAISPTKSLVTACHGFPGMTVELMVDILRHHFRHVFSDPHSLVAVRTAVAPFVGRARFFMEHVLEDFVHECQDGHCDTTDAWLRVLNTVTERNRISSTHDLKALFVGYATEPDRMIHSDSGVTVTRATLFRTCFFAVLMGSNTITRSHLVDRELVRSAVACVPMHDDEVLRLDDEPIAFAAMRGAALAVVETARGNVDADPVFRHLLHVQDYPLGAVTELFLAWAITRRCLHAASRLQAVLGNLLAHPMPRALLDVCVPRLHHATHSNCTLGASPYDVTMQSLLAKPHCCHHKIENGFGPDIATRLDVEPGPGFGRGPGPSARGFFVVQCKNQAQPSFATAARSLQPTLSYRSSGGGATQGRELALAALREATGAGQCVWVRALFSTRPWGKEALQEVQTYNEEHPWSAMLLLDLSGHTRGLGTPLQRLPRGTHARLQSDARPYNPATFRHLAWQDPTKTPKKRARSQRRGRRRPKKRRRCSGDSE